MFSATLKCCHALEIIFTFVQTYIIGHILRVQTPVFTCFDCWGSFMWESFKNKPLPGPVCVQVWTFPVFSRAVSSSLTHTCGNRRTVQEVQQFGLLQNLWWPKLQFIWTLVVHLKYLYACGSHVIGSGCRGSGEQDCSCCRRRDFSGRCTTQRSCLAPAGGETQWGCSMCSFPAAPLFQRSF